MQFLDGYVGEIRWIRRNDHETIFPIDARHLPAPLEHADDAVT
jgi:hypothetical protein